MLTKISPALQNALIIFFSAVTATALVTFLRIPYGFITIITCFVLLLIYHEQIYLKTVERVLGPSLAFIIAASLLFILQHHAILFACSAILLTFFFMYYYAQAHHAYAMILAGITVAFMSSMAFVQNINVGMQVGFYWTSNIIIGAIIVLLFASIERKLFPASKIDKRFITALSFSEYWQQWRLKTRFDYSAFIIATRIMLTFAIILLINYSQHWTAINMQAIIAGAIVASQLSKAHQRAIYRILGIVLGAITALLLAHILAVLPWQQFFVILSISVMLALAALASYRWPQINYIFLQAGMMLPVILIHQNGVASTTLALTRALGSLEGGLIAVVMVFISHLFLPKKKN